MFTKTTKQQKRQLDRTDKKEWTFVVSEPLSTTSRGLYQEQFPFLYEL